LYPGGSPEYFTDEVVVKPALDSFFIITTFIFFERELFLTAICTNRPSHVPCPVEMIPASFLASWNKYTAPPECAIVKPNVREIRTIHARQVFNFIFFMVFL
jgi:hypothetical protein